MVFRAWFVKFTENEGLGGALQMRPMQTACRLPLIIPSETPRLRKMSWQSSNVVFAESCELWVSSG